MCVLSATQVLASAFDKSDGSKSISVSQLIRYNDLLLESLPDYFNIIDLDELSFEVGSIASEFEITINENYERIIKVSHDEPFNYDPYRKTMPQEVAQKLEAIALPC